MQHINRFNTVSLHTISSLTVYDIINSFTIEDDVKKELLFYIEGTFNNVIDFVHYHLSTSLMRVRAFEGSLTENDINQVEHMFTLKNNPCYEEELFQLDPYDVLCGKYCHTNIEYHGYEVMVETLGEIHKDLSAEEIFVLADKLYEPINVLLWTIQLRIFSHFYTQNKNTGETIIRLEVKRNHLLVYLCY